MPTRRDLVAEAGSSGRRALNGVGTELREARLVAGLSQRTVAARLGTSQRRIGRVEFGTLQDLGIVAISRHAAVLGLQAAAAGVFTHVSWRHWPRRVFALPQELPGYWRRLRVQAWVMLGLIGTSFLVALVVSVGATDA